MIRIKNGRKPKDGQKPNQGWTKTQPRMEVWMIDGQYMDEKPRMDEPNQE